MPELEPSILTGEMPTQKLVEVFAMEKSADELREQFGHRGDHPVHPVSEWEQEVWVGNTRLGYWDWAAMLLELEEESEEISAPEDLARTAQRLHGTVNRRLSPFDAARRALPERTSSPNNRSRTDKESK